MVDVRIHDDRSQAIQGRGSTTQAESPAEDVEKLIAVFAAVEGGLGQ